MADPSSLDFQGFSELQLGFLSFTSTPIHCSNEAKAFDIEHTHHMTTFNMDFHCQHNIFDKFYAQFYEDSFILDESMVFLMNPSLCTRNT